MFTKYRAFDPQLIDLIDQTASRQLLLRPDVDHVCCLAELTVCV